MNATSMKTYKKKLLTPEVMVLLKGVGHKGPDPICDFCGDKSPVTVYAASRMSTGIAADCWRWCACKDCEYLLDMNLYEAVVGRIVHRMQEITGRHYSVDTIREAAINAFQTFLDFAIETEETPRSDA